jgi:long-chain acyl-CoA synthetase
MRQTIADYLADFGRMGGETAYAELIGYRLLRTSYGQVARLAFAFARELTRRGIRKGDRVVIWGPNSARWVAAFLGCAHRGVVAVPMDDGASEDFALRVSNQVEARLMLSSRDHRGAELPVFCLEGLDGLLRTHSCDPFAAERISHDDPLEIVFTSGTTAEPKGVVISHGNVLANVSPLEDQIRPYLKYERFVHPLRFLNLLPLSHVFGQFLGIYLPPLLGATVLFQDTLKPAEVIGTIRRQRISVLVAVPRMLESLKQKIERDLEAQGRLEGFRRQYLAAESRSVLRRWWMFRAIHGRLGWKFWAFICGGAALQPALEQFWARLGFAVVQGYGLTETTSLISVNHPFKVSRGSIGKVLAGRDVKLAADGEILVRGSGVASGYWSAGRLQAVSSQQGWYHTGDIGELDAQGNLFFKGRKKDVIVTSAGMNVYPEDLERALNDDPDIKAGVVLPVEQDGNAEPCAVLVLRPGSADPAHVLERVNRRLAEYQRIRRWIVWPDQDFPRTSTGKPRRAEIARALQHPTTDGGRPSTPAPTALASLISRITSRPAETLREHATLDSDLKLSSLERVELLSALEDRYQTELSESRFSAVRTIGDLQQMITGGAAPPRPVYHYPRWVERWPVTWIRFLVHYLLLRPAVFFLGWPRVLGREKLGGLDGPVLVVSNHVADVDVGFILTALPARFRHRLATAAGGEALEALRTPPPGRNFFLRVFDGLEWLLGVSLLNLFPLPRETGFRDSFRYAGESVDRGYSILIFPEGHHTTDGKIRPFRSGIGLLVQNLGLAVIPMRIDGLFELKQAGRHAARPFQVTVKMGAPVRFAKETPPEQIAAELKRVVEQL